jgi:hypothetical protein
MPRKKKSGSFGFWNDLMDDGHVVSADDLIRQVTRALDGTEHHSAKATLWFDQEDYAAMTRFCYKYAEEHGLPRPSLRLVVQSFMNLPSLRRRLEKLAAKEERGDLVPKEFRFLAKQRLAANRRGRVA